MSSNLPTIDDLLKKNQKQEDVTADAKQRIASALNISSSEVQEKFKKKINEVNLKEKEYETMKLAQRLHLPHIDLDKFPISHEALKQIPRTEAQRLKTVCFFYDQDEIRIGAMNPVNAEVLDLLEQLQDKNQAEGGLYVISENSFNRVMRLYDNLPEVKPITKDVNISVEDLDEVASIITDLNSFQELLKKRSTSDILTLFLGAALKLDASDIHVEAEKDQITIRFRLDGILHDAAEIPRSAYERLISRIKLVASLKINVTDKPQDGRFTMRLPDGDVDLRVSTMPTVFGESVVMRLLHQSREGLDLDSMGLKGAAYAKLRQEIERPSGMVITTGPTGSGKTTTMYAIMKIINKPGVKIITLEDPVEYRMEGINQSQVDFSKGYDFAKGLKSILRQDPDIAMVGEIRDLETAETAIQAALTGHLILSTIHTNNAAGVIPRFLSMGVKPFLLAPALNAVIGQRLVRRICPHCIEEEELDIRTLEKVGKAIENMSEEVKKSLDIENFKFYKGKGCKECSGIGYKGRIGIFEIFSITPEIEKMILGGRTSEYDIQQAAINNGMVTMVQDGIIKALEKLTTLEEVFRVAE
ncbi:MAG TPA: GspE/PulE family protein [Candidatus Magasanikbacteria bacterium]|jgi:type IV pilus assembly protein PilB|nr:type II/IV secretion system protein [Candidatus Magasanikbacteria bacterium]HQF57234.1 GspE/PulE family protein [Candidatus Magasanikbacteria bacterium]HQL52637.1 GspE/PulE family protein [Candidatus Magasanikbacteria bacterium]